MEMIQIPAKPAKRQACTPTLKKDWRSPQRRMQRDSECPHSKEDEKMILGCMLVSEACLVIGVKGLFEEDFYYCDHRTIFNSMKFGYSNGYILDLHGVCSDLANQGKLEEIGGVVYLATLGRLAGYDLEYDFEKGLNIVKKKTKERKKMEKKISKGKIRSAEGWRKNVEELYGKELGTEKKVENKSDIVQLAEKVREKRVEHKEACKCSERKKDGFLEKFMKWLSGSSKGTNIET
jgi:replicative DNA helicase